ncbi:MAG: L,D-transpeptidase family protein [Lentisphaeria bacterium]|nr:L,D-transpeptidase family protein [Lentisphaeria bacterium]
MPVHYDFKNSSRNLPRRRNAGYKRLRFFGVLLIVAAITVAVVMIIVPDTAPQSGSDTSKNENSGTEQKTEQLSSSGENNNTSGNSTQNSSATSTQNSNNNSSQVGDGGASSNSGTDSGSSTSNTGGTSDTDNGGGSLETWYQKGSTVPGGDAGDSPVYKPNQAPGADEVIAKLKTLTSPDEVISVATAFLMKEYSSGGCCSANWNQIGAYLTAAVHTEFSSGKWKNNSIIHKVSAGNNLSTIARRYSTTVEGIKKINKKRNNLLRIGERLTVIPGKWRITIAKNSHTLNLWKQEKNGWQIFAVFPIGVGRKNSTPTGKFNISHRLYHPKWHGPDGRIFAYGDKENPLGECFLKLSGRTGRGAGRQGYGIHGSPDDTSVGKALSRGCIRMHNQDVLLLYYLVPVTTPVEITD